VLLKKMLLLGLVLSEVLCGFAWGWLTALGRGFARSRSAAGDQHIGDGLLLLSEKKLLQNVGIKVL
jgi:hypothetical protein